MILKSLAFAALFFTVFAAAAAPARAESSVYHGGTYVGSVVVEPGQTVKGDLTVIAGDATIAGMVDGNVVVIGGYLFERPGAVITGQVNTVGGDVVSERRAVGVAARSSAAVRRLSNALARRVGSRSSCSSSSSFRCARVSPSTASNAILDSAPRSDFSAGSRFCRSRCSCSARSY